VVHGLVYAPDGRTLASGADDGTVRLWDVHSGAGELLATQGPPIRALAISRSGRYLASGDKAGGLWVWDLREKRLLRQLEGATAAVLSLTFSADETQLAGGSYDQRVRLWDLGTGRARVFDCDGYVSTVRFSPDGKALVSGSSDGTVRLWDLASGKPRSLTGHLGNVASLDFSPDGGRLLSAGGTDQTVRLWDLENGKYRVVHHYGTTLLARFSADGKRVISGGTDLRVWSDDLPWDAAGLDAWIASKTNDVAEP
jgi:WD40 repeat protein